MQRARAQTQNQTQTRAYDFYRDGGHWYTLTLARGLWQYAEINSPDIDAFFMRTGYTLFDSPAALMISVFYRKEHTSDSSLSDFAMWEQRSMEEQYPNIEYHMLDWELDNLHGHPMLFRRVEGEGFLQFIAYVDSGRDYIVSLVLQAYEDAPFYAEQLQETARTLQLHAVSFQIER